MANKPFISIFTKYYNFPNVFYLKLTSKLLKYTGINNHVINQIDIQQPLYQPIYSLRLGKLEILKNHIKTNLISNFIKLLIPKQMFLFFLIRNQIKTSTFILIIKDSIILQSKIDIH